jgi:hypothetical protein
MCDVTEIKWKNVHAGGERNTPDEWDRTFDESSFISLITGLFYRKAWSEYRARDGHLDTATVIFIIEGATYRKIGW